MIPDRIAQSRDWRITARRKTDLEGKVLDAWGDTTEFALDPTRLTVMCGTSWPGSREGVKVIGWPNEYDIQLKQDLAQLDL